jgi:hypothetical protein
MALLRTQRHAWVERVVLNAVAKRMRLRRLIFALSANSHRLRRSGSTFGSKVERSPRRLLNALAKGRGFAVEYSRLRRLTCHHLQEKPIHLNVRMDQ